MESSQKKEKKSRTIKNNAKLNIRLIKKISKF